MKAGLVMVTVAEEAGEATAGLEEAATAAG
jgi:hypothetical protein